MILALLLLACTAEPPEPAEAPEPVEAPVNRKVTKAAWVGDWVKDNKILAIDDKQQLRLMEDGEVVMQGTLEGTGLKRTAALDGCGATLKLSEVGGDITVRLSGPECAVYFAGLYQNTVSP